MFCKLAFWFSWPYTYKLSYVHKNATYILKNRPYSEKRVWAISAEGSLETITALVPNSTTRHRLRTTTATDFYNLLYNKFTTNGHKFATSQHPVEMMGSCIAMWRICCTTSCRIVVILSVGGVVQHVRSRCPCSAGVWHLQSRAAVRLVKVNVLLTNIYWY